MRLFRRSRPQSRGRTAEADDLVLRQLEGLGADLARPRHVVHFLLFSHERDAEDAAAAAEEAGYEVEVSAPDESRGPWSVRAGTTRVVSPTTVEAYRAWFERLASEYRGEYDGWEAARTP